MSESVNKEEALKTCLRTMVLGQLMLWDASSIFEEIVGKELSFRERIENFCVGFDELPLGEKAKTFNVDELYNEIMDEIESEAG